MIGVRMARLAVGAAEMLAPEKVLLAVVRGRPDESELVVCQILGARHVVQALFPRWLPAGRFACGPTLDLLHAASMVGLAAASPRYRRPAIANAAEALTFAVLSIRS